MSEVGKQYVCFIKRRAGGRFVPYTAVDDSSKFVVKTMREFLDHDISKFMRAGQEDEVFIKVDIEHFIADVDTAGLNSKLAGMLGWNYPAAARIVESEGWVLILTAHPRFESIPFSFIRTRDDDNYALELVKQLWSLRGGEIRFEEYDPVKHVAGYRYEE